jgi:hypothetical protein
MISHKRGSKLDHREPSKQWSTGPRCMELWACWMVNRISCTAEHDGAYLMVPFIIFWPKEWPAGIFISIFLGSTSCDFQWSYRAIYIHELGWTMLEVDEITSKLGTFIPKCSDTISRFGSILAISFTLKLGIYLWNFPLYFFWAINRPKKTLMTSN